jgi:putative endonuclease
VAAERRDSGKRATGAQVEALACGFLQGHALVPVAANANYRGGELDLVMRDGGTLVFVEVRFRRSAGSATTGFGDGAASIDAAKRRKIVHAAERFLAAHGEFARMPCRFDVIDASGDADAPKFVWLRDAFRADDV